MCLEGKKIEHFTDKKGIPASQYYFLSHRNSWIPSKIYLFNIMRFESIDTEVALIKMSNPQSHLHLLRQKYHKQYKMAAQQQSCQIPKYRFENYTLQINVSSYVLHQDRNRAKYKRFQMLYSSFRFCIFSLNFEHQSPVLKIDRRRDFTSYHETSSSLK